MRATFVLLLCINMAAKFWFSGNFYSKDSLFVTIFQIEFIEFIKIFTIVAVFVKAHIATLARIYNHIIIMKPFSSYLKAAIF